MKVLYGNSQGKQCSH